MRENKFLAIYNDLADKIQKGKYMTGELLPSEHELADRYDSSRETIRKALNFLSQNGYIQKVRGKGSIVLDVGKYDFPVSGLVSFKELATRTGKPWKTNVHELVLVKPNHYIQQQLKLKKTDEVWKVVRSREIDDEKIILDIDYIKKQFVPTITKDCCENSLYNYFENDLNLVISFAKKEITVEEASSADKACLDLKGYTHVVVVKNYVYLEDASLLQYTESRHRLDKFRFVDFARRERR
ncbi:GntR family trehalose operon transcriptional repressor [Scopulibacillus daqui]|uniref:Trehalose operon repressor n=1 Tax=Scopulibacillus daqui TaxID=1469162 RepID=A0ABS2PY29_9BACL|nr:trehalose operon repressor [Scopulibacillus daqui]MBM7644958.1 GntR family trehalose operon transcriptional repressor [Scopulibacillus daqui]